MDSKLFCKVIQRIERAARVEPFLILAVAALDLAVVARRVRTDQLMPDIQLGGRLLKQRRQVTLTIRLLLEKRLVNSKPLSVWTHSTCMPLRAYHARSFRRKSAEEYVVDCSG